jgi:excisionase family DNA binding protein
MDQLLTPKQIAEKLGVKLSTLYNWTHIGFIPHTKLGGLLRFREKDIELWIQKRSQAGRATRRPSI